MNALLDSLQAGFDQLPEAQLEALGLGGVRRAALQRALAEGLPTQRSEAWKYTALRALAARKFSAFAESSPLAPAFLAALPSPRMVFVNGRFDRAGSSLDGLPDGLQLHALSDVLVAGQSSQSEAGAAIAGNLTQDAGPPDQAFARINTALAVEGSVLSVAADTRASLHVVFIGAPAADDIASHLRHVLRVGEGAELQLVEHHIASGSHRHLSNQVLDLELAPGSRVIHARMQDEDAGATLLARSEIRIQAGAEYRRLDLEMGAALSRHEMVVLLAGEQARFVSGGAMLGGSRRHIDARLRVLHRAPNCSCDLLWRGLASDRARLAFHGGIVIEAGADGSDARLSNKNLLLSEGAEIDTQPALEIFADEVKAAHGATIGRLDDTALFYLRSRGIPEAQARALLTQAFCRQALAVFEDSDLLALLTPQLESRLLTLEPSL